MIPSPFGWVGPSLIDACARCHAPCHGACESRSLHPHSSACRAATSRGFRYRSRRGLDFRYFSVNIAPLRTWGPRQQRCDYATRDGRKFYRGVTDQRWVRGAISVITVRCVSCFGRGSGAAWIGLARRPPKRTGRLYHASLSSKHQERRLGWRQPSETDSSKMLYLRIWPIKPVFTSLAVDIFLLSSVLDRVYYGHFLGLYRNKCTFRL
jgi:hypothetical protein